MQGRNRAGRFGQDSRRSQLKKWLSGPELPSYFRREKVFKTLGCRGISEMIRGISCLSPRGGKEGRQARFRFSEGGGGIKEIYNR